MKVADRFVHEYLAATRIVDERPVGALVPMYEAMFAACSRSLGLDSERPTLHVTRTAQAISQTLRLDSGQHVVIYDQYQGRVNHRLNRFVYEDFPVDLVVRFFLRHTRIACVSAGSLTSAALSGALLDVWPVKGDRSSEPASRSTQNTRMATGFQECFVIAHELAHLAMECGRIPHHLTDLVDHLVCDISTDIGSAGATIEQYLTRRQHRNEFDGWQAIVGEAVAAEFQRSRDGVPYDMEGLRAFAADLPSQLSKHPQVREEALCDALASITVMNVFNPKPHVAAPALVLALWNHTTLAMMRQRVARMVGDDAMRERDEHRWSLMPLAMRGWILLRLWEHLVGRHQTAEVAGVMAQFVLLQRERHDARVYAVAHATPFLVFTGMRSGAMDALADEESSPLLVRQDVLADMGADGYSGDRTSGR